MTNKEISAAIEAALPYVMHSEATNPHGREVATLALQSALAALRNADYPQSRARMESAAMAAREEVLIAALREARSYLRPPEGSKWAHPATYAVDAIDRALMASAPDLLAALRQALKVAVPEGARLHAECAAAIAKATTT